MRQPYTRRNAILDLVEYFGKILVASVVIVLFIAMVGQLIGCTATGYDRQAAQMAAAKGCYCKATKCDEVVSAVGVAATVAAEKEAVKQIEVRR